MYGHPKKNQIQAKIATIRPVFPVYISVSYDYSLTYLHNSLAFLTKGLLYAESRT